MSFDQFAHEKKEKERDIVSISINKEERIILDIFKQMVGIDNDSQALKHGMILAKNVIHSLSGDSLDIILLKRKAKKRRKIQNLMQKRNM